MRKKRKERSDKGVTKGPKKKPSAREIEEDSDKENEEEPGPSKKKRKVDARKKGKGKGVATKKGKAANARSQLPPSDEFLTDTDYEDYD